MHLLYFNLALARDNLGNPLLRRYGRAVNLWKGRVCNAWKNETYTWLVTIRLWAILMWEN